tara:strand:- start:127 stop:708 length:582 start_codon:yes stop_codon:yes gene_type:complete
MRVILDKTCTKCLKTKKAFKFNKDRQKIDGLTSSCKSCESIRGNQYRKDNAQKIKTYHKKYQKENPKKLRDYSRRYKEENPEKVTATAKRCYENNKKDIIYIALFVDIESLYVGSTITGLDKRKCYHTSRLRRGIHDNKAFQNAFDTYGEDAITWKVIEDVDNQSELLKLEQFWIDQFPNTFNMKHAVTSKKL